MRIQIGLGLCCLLLVQAARALTFQEFVQCVGTMGQGPICKLDPGTYPISSTIYVGRSSITVAGAIVNGQRSTTLRRAAGFQGALLQDLGAQGTALHSIIIRDLTLDGNRTGNQSPYYSYQPDVSIFSVKNLLIVNCAFSNSPNIGLALYGAGTADVVVNKCLFSNPVIYGLWSDATGDNSNLSYLDCDSLQFVRDVTVSYSRFEGAGEPAILGEMINLKILNNVFTNNHSYSIPFNDDGGQIDLTTCTKDALISRNIFQNGSASPNGHTADGIELHGTYISVIDNVIKKNSGGGINLDGTQHILIANWDPGTGNFENGHSGIEIAHSSASFRKTEWITIQSATSAKNSQWGIWSDTSNTTPSEPVDHLTITNSCLGGNLLGPTFLNNLGADVSIEDNETTGCERRRPE